MSRYVKVEGERGLYQDPNSGVYYVRVQYGGRDTYKSLETNLKRKALEGLDARRQAKVAAKFGLALEPDEVARTSSVAEIIKKFQEAGYPDKRGRKREDGVYLRSQRDYCDTLLTFFKDGTLTDDLRPKILSQYHEWRVGNVIRGTGHRTTDLELTTLSNALDWAVREELIEVNPVKSRLAFTAPRRRGTAASLPHPTWTSCTPSPPCSAGTGIGRCWRGRPCSRVLLASGPTRRSACGSTRGPTNREVLPRTAGHCAFDEAKKPAGIIPTSRCMKVWCS